MSFRDHYQQHLIKNKYNFNFYYTILAHKLIKRGEKLTLTFALGDIFQFLKRRSAGYALHKSNSNEIVEKVVVDLRFKNKINSKQHILHCLHAYNINWLSYQLKGREYIIVAYIYAKNSMRGRSYCPTRA